MALTALTLTTEQFAVHVQGVSKEMVKFAVVARTFVKIIHAMMAFNAFKLTIRHFLSALSARLASQVKTASTAWTSMNASPSDPAMSTSVARIYHLVFDVTRALEVLKATKLKVFTWKPFWIILFNDSAVRTSMSVKKALLNVEITRFVAI